MNNITNMHITINKHYNTSNGLLILTQYFAQNPKHITEGLKYLKKLIVVEKSAKLFFDYATICKSAKLNNEAKWALINALKLDKNNIIYHAHLGYIIYNLGNQIEGINHLQKVFHMIQSVNKKQQNKWTDYEITEYISVYENLCVFYTAVNKQQEVIKVVTSGIALFPTKFHGCFLKYINKHTDNNLNNNQNISDNTNHHFEQGKLFVQKGDLPAAAREFLIVCELMPNSGVAHYSAAMALRFIGERESAFLHSEIAFKIEPDNMMFFGDYMHMLKATCRWRKFNEHWNIVQKTLNAKDYKSLEHFRLSGVYWGFSMELLHDLTVRSTKISEIPLNLQYQHTPNPNNINNINNTNKKLKIAYVSSNYRNHAQGFQMLSYFKEHNRDQFEIYAFSLFPAITSDAMKIRDRLKSQVDHWIEVHDMDAKQTAAIINSHNIDIAIDLCGQADHPRLETYAYKPAPIQISFLGYPGTTGATYMDYYISDPISTPLSMSQYFTEKLILLPDSYQITEHKEEYPIESFTTINKIDKINKSDKSDQVIFCNFNNPVKISHEIFTAWMNILKQVPNSILWLFSTNIDKNIIEEAILQGIDSERIVILPSVDKLEHLKRLQKADLLLDTTIYGAHTSAGDALWAGVPILTILENTMPSRVCASMVTAAGFPEMIVNSVKEYEEKAIELGNNVIQLQNLRRKVENNRMEMKLFDTKKYVTNIEVALREVWRKFSLSLDIEAIEVDKLI